MNLGFSDSKAYALDCAILPQTLNKELLSPSLSIVGYHQSIVNAKDIAEKMRKDRHWTATVN